VRVLLALLAFGATSAALLAMTSQLAPGWRPAGIETPLNPRPADPAARRQVHEVRQTSAEITVEGSHNLAAWIVQPRESSEARAMPGLVLVQGAGRGGRESLIATARAFAAAGTAVIIYDKRTAGYSVLARDYAMLAKDAIRAAEVLADAPGVDPRRIGILGFSEGGWVAPLAVQAAPQRFAFLVLASAAIVTPLEQSVWIVDQKLAGAPQAIRRMAAVALASGRTLINYLDFDVRSTLATLDLPVYAIWGAADPIVPINVAVRRLTDASPCPVTVRILRSAEHQLPTKSGWEVDLANWIASPPNLEADNITGVEPASAVGVGSLPASRWYLNPILHTILSAGAAILIFVMTSRKPPIG
jgi:pimeloyl-ACP methyl ester carboxylesterase